MIDLTTFKAQLVGEGNPEYFLYNNQVACIEPKIDGIRILLSKHEQGVKLFSRNGKEWTDKFPSILKALADELTAPSAVLDGELAVMRGKEFTCSKDVLKTTLEADERYVYFVFDVLEIGDAQLMDEPLVTRKQNLQLILNPRDVISLVPYTFVNNMEDVNILVRKAIEGGMEGIVLKNLSKYSQNSRYNWLKLKPMKTLDLTAVSREDRKDGKGWIYHLTGEGVETKACSTLDIPVGAVAEVKYQAKFENALRFPQIIRIRDDL